MTSLAHRFTRHSELLSSYKSVVDSITMNRFLVTWSTVTKDDTLLNKCADEHEKLLQQKRIVRDQLIDNEESLSHIDLFVRYDKDKFAQYKTPWSTVLWNLFLK